MSKKCGGSEAYWQSSLLNSSSYMMYRDWILSLAMLRYRWVNLPKTCDARYLEWTLAMEGCATICSTELGWVSTKATSGTLNVYDNPTHWQSTGNNGWYAEVDPSTGVLVWDNMLRRPIWNNIHLWSLRLSEYDRVLDVNLQQQKIPWIMTGPQEKTFDMTNIMKQAVGGEPAVIGLRGIDSIDVNLLTTAVEFKGDALYSAKQRLWNEIYSYLGIKSVDEKAERMIEAEVQNSDDPTEIRALDGLRCRREAARYLNEHFGLNVQVYWNRDLESSDWNFLHDLRQQAEDGAERDDPNQPEEVDNDARTER